MKPGERLAALEGLRGYAALLVFLVHACGVLAASLYHLDLENHRFSRGDDPLAVILLWLTRSHYGVDLFFVLSGMLMADIALNRWPGTRQFLARRFLRIYPAYAASSVLTALVVIAWFGGRFQAWDVLANAALLQGFFVLGIPAINAVSWSLSYEAAFYLAVPAMAARCASPPSVMALAAAMAGIVIASAIAPVPKVIYLAYFALFIPGIALGLMKDTERAGFARSLPLPLVVGAWIAFTLAMKLGVISNTGAAYYFCSATASGLLVAKACDARGILARVLSARVPRSMGKYSYSFFLIHYPLVHILLSVTRDLAPGSNRFVYCLLFFVLSLVASLAAARVLYALTERFYFRRRQVPA